MKYKILLVIFAACLVVSTLIATTPTSGLCGADGTSGCSTVANSPYSKIFGIDNAIWGMLAFTILLVLTIIQMRRPNKKNKKLIQIGTLLVAIFSFYFLSLMAFIIKAWCKYCLIVDILAIAAMLFAFFYAEQD